jgi:hypothetical protein
MVKIIQTNCVSGSQISHLLPDITCNIHFHVMFDLLAEEANLVKDAEKKYMEAGRI